MWPSRFFFAQRGAGTLRSFSSRGSSSSAAKREARRLRRGQEIVDYDSRRDFTAVLVGRPNVGKSTLFNRLVGRRDAIVSNIPGTTRDRREGAAMLAGLSFRVVDTGGLEDVKGRSMMRARMGGERVPLQRAMTQQTELAILDASVVLFLVDARQGVTADDRHFAQWLRRRGAGGRQREESGAAGPAFPPVQLVLTKAEGLGDTLSAWEGGDTRWEDTLRECYQLGLGQPVALSSTQGLGMTDLFDVLEPFSRVVAATTAGQVKALEPAVSEADDEALESEGALQVAIVGRTNVGKSTLLNKLVKFERSVTGPMAGLTRDEIRVEWECDGRRLQLIDTAGIRRKSRLYRAAKSANAELTDLHLAHETMLRGNDREHGGPDRGGRKHRKEVAMNEAEMQHSALEQLAINASLRAMALAHAVVVVVDVSTPEAVDGSGRYSGGANAHTARTLEDLRGLYVPGPLTREDLNIVARVVDEGRAVILVANKCDAVPPPAAVSDAPPQPKTKDSEGRLLGEGEQTLTQWARPQRRARRPNRRPPSPEGFHFRYPVVDRIQDQLHRAVPFAEGIPVIPLSALDGRGVDALLPRVLDVSAQWERRIPANALQRWLTRVQERNPPPAAKSSRRDASGRFVSRTTPVRIKLVHQSSQRPPTFALFVNRYEPRNSLPPNYLQFLRKELRREFGLWGVPIRFTVRGKYKPGNEPVTLTKM